MVTLCQRRLGCRICGRFRAGGSDKAKEPSGESPSESMVAIEFMLVPSMGPGGA